MSARYIPRHARLALLVVVVCVGALAAAPAAQAAPTAYLQLATSQAPTNLAVGSRGKLLATATNLGDAPLSGEVLVTDHLPAGLTALAVSGALANKTSEALACVLKSTHEVTCAYKGAPLSPLTGLKVAVTVQVDGQVQSPQHVEAVSGAINASTDAAIRLSSEPAPYGIEKYTFKPEREGGAVDQQAGSHPFQLTTTIGVNQTSKEEPVALTKNLQFSLPAGLIGNPQATPKCTQTQFNTIVAGPSNLCPAASAIGEAEVTIEEPNTFNTGPEARTVPIFNLEPAPGEPARFGLLPLKDPVILETSIKTGSDYGVVVTAKSTTQVAGLVSSIVSFWGTPGDPVHNPDRGWHCVAHGELFGGEYGTCEAQQAAERKTEAEAKEKGEYSEPPPFLQLPTSCGKALSSPAQAQSWVPGAVYQPPVESEFSTTLEGCSFLQANPLLSVEPDTHAASTPTGMTVSVDAPQKESAGPGGEKLVESALMSTTVVLPQGLQLNPAAAGGLLACSALQVGFLGAEERTQLDNREFSPAPDGCPDAAKVGTVEIVSPDLGKEVPRSAEHPLGMEPDPLKGFVYLASQDTNPFQAPLVIYLIARDPVSGVLVKLAGTVTPDPATGQLTSTFENTPQVPFEHLKLHFFAGGRASQATPDQCGSYTTTSTFTPWSGNAAATPSSSFAISSGPGGGPCPSNPLPFAPGLAAGSDSVQAGAFTNFSLTVGHSDGHQALTGLSVHLPPGMAAMLSSLTPCPIAQADAGQCGPASLVGHSITFSGLGDQPFPLAGTAYLTGPIAGAPFGISVLTPAVAGPFNLGTVIANSTITVDPSTAAVTVTAVESRVVDPFGVTTIPPTPLPTIIKGVPVQIKAVHVAVDRSNFQFNPTNCNPLRIEGVFGGAGGGSSTAAVPFQVANCSALPFAPVLTSTTNSTFSRSNGVTLVVKVTSTPGQANIAKTKLVLPLQLPSRLTTIQKACLDAVFKANPAACGEGSNIGYAIVHTPVLKNPLVGPAYLVSHGGAAFPDVEFVLQGEGIKLVLDGLTNIHNGITTSTFNAVPDAPVSSFEAILPAGPHSALGAYLPNATNLCGSNLIVPTTITGQNGDVIQQNTKITVNGCGGVKGFKSTRAQLLAKALKACKKKRPRSKRVSCERAARKKYGARKHAAKKH